VEINTSVIANFEKEFQIQNVQRNDNNSVTSSGKSNQSFTKKGIIKYLTNKNPDSMIRMIDLILFITFITLILASTLTFVILFLNNKNSESVYYTLGR
jgi:hypothetical protein